MGYAINQICLYYKTALRVCGSVRASDSFAYIGVATTRGGSSEARALGCIRSPRLFSNNFYLVLKCCILVNNETS